MPRELELVSARELIRYGQGQLRPALERALDQLDAVHLVPKGHPVALRAVRNKHHYTLTYKPRRALLITTYPYSETTWTESIIQCFGYHLDMMLLSGFDYASKDPDGPFAAVIAAALASQPAEEIRAMARFWEGREGGKGQVHRAGWLRLLEPHYLFARAYSQWVVARADCDEELLRRMREPRRSRDDEQRWSLEEFAPIHAALDQAFRELDWLGFAPFKRPQSRLRPSGLSQRLARRAAAA
jgi:hypothetical protein